LEFNLIDLIQYKFNSITTTVLIPSHYCQTFA